jgi:NADH dehydrogenase
MANVTGWLPGAPMTRDQWIMLQQDNVVAEGAKTLKTLGVSATPLSAVIDEWMVRYRPHGRFESKRGGE